MTEAAENKYPTRLATAIFRSRAMLLQLRRGAQNMAGDVQAFPCVPIVDMAERYPFVLAQSRTRLYANADLTEQGLQLGKVQNLRSAVRHLNGLLLPAGETFSFWTQIGRATRRRGFVAGRQLQEGCLFPAVGGGLCQLSNALYDVAMQATCEVVERHPHTRIVPGSAAQEGRDATVAWNYIDLRFRAPFPLYFEAVLTRDELIVRLRTAEEEKEKRRKGEEEKGESKSVARSFILHPSPSLNAGRPLVDKHQLLPLLPLLPQEHSCVTCGVEACFRHESADVKRLRAQAKEGRSLGRTAFLVEETMSELGAYVQEQCHTDSTLMLPLDGRAWNKPGYAWPTEGYTQVITAAVPTLLRAYRSRTAGTDGPVRRRAQLEGAECLAAYFARRLSWDVTHIVVAQSLLPFLWRDGHLGGRTFDVLMTRLPLHELQNRLDAAFTQHPERVLLRDFRAHAELVTWEQEALQAARRIVTPHSDIAALFPSQAMKLEWQMPTAMPISTALLPRGAAIAFPGPTHARKGAFELRNAARALNLEVVLLGSELEGANFWQGVRTRHITVGNGTDWLQDICAVVQPALVEDKPRRLLQALAQGVPVIATPACGLGSMPNLITVPAGSEAALRQAIACCFSAQPSAPCNAEHAEAT